MTEWPTRLSVSSPIQTADPLRIDENLSTSETELQSLSEQRVLNDLTEKLKRCLSEHPRNYSLAAKKLNIDRRMVVKLVAEFEGELEDEYLDQIEENVIRTIKGLEVTDQNFRFNDSLKVLERLRADRWSNKKAAKKKTIAVPSEAWKMLRGRNQGD